MKILSSKILITVCIIVLAPMAMAAGADSDVSKLGVTTLDRVKAEETAFLNTNSQTYTLREITDDVTAPDGAVMVKVGDKEYYYTPSDNKELLQLLSSTGSTALVETTSDKALYSTPDGKYYTYDNNKLKNSGYTLTKVTPSDPDNLDDNVIVKYEIKEVTKYYDPQTGLEVAEGDKQDGVNYREVVTKETVPHYYEVNPAKTEYGNGSEKIYFNWEKDASGNYTLKEGASATGDNSIIYSYDETGFSNTVSDQVLDKSMSNPTGTSSSPTIIEGGAAVNNPSGTTITIDNTLYKNNVTQAVIESTTSGYKYAELVGGAVYNKGTISSITGQFINNGIDLTTNKTSGFLYTYAKGGAIYNEGEIGDITANFIGNYVKNTNTTSYTYPYAQGGAIYNEAGEIGDITGDFIGNYAISTGTSSNSGYYANGGAIYNYGGTTETPKVEENAGDFSGNYAISTGTSSSSG